MRPATSHRGVSGVQRITVAFIASPTVRAAARCAAFLECSRVSMRPSSLDRAQDASVLSLTTRPWWVRAIAQMLPRRSAARRDVDDQERNHLAAGDPAGDSQRRASVAKRPARLQLEQRAETEKIETPRVRVQRAQPRLAVADVQGERRMPARPAHGDLPPRAWSTASCRSSESNLQPVVRPDCATHRVGALQRQDVVGSSEGPRRLAQRPDPRAGENRRRARVEPGHIRQRRGRREGERDEQSSHALDRSAPGAHGPEARLEPQSCLIAWIVAPMPGPVATPAVVETRVACAAVAIASRPGEYIASSNAAAVDGFPTAKTVVASPPEIDVEM